MTNTEDYYLLDAIYVWRLALKHILFPRSQGVVWWSWYWQNWEEG